MIFRPTACLIALYLLTAQNTYAQKSISITGAAASQPGVKIKVERFEDFFTRNMVLLSETTLGQDSTFELKFNLDQTEKVKISVNQDFVYLFVQPGATYKIAISDKRLRNFINPQGNELDSRLLDLSNEDINYKIVAFNAWYDQFMGDNYHLRTRRDSTFLKNLITFETNVSRYYEKETDEFLKTYVKFRTASIEDLNFIGARNERARYTVNLSPFTVYYKSEEYMLYVKSFFKNYFESLSPEMNNQIYKAILAGSPTKMVNILAKDYRVANVRLRELVMILSLADVYHDKQYPQSKINIVLDSIAKNGLFKENQIVAKNTINKLRQLNPGSAAPNYSFYDRENNEIGVKKFQPKYTYIQFVNTEQTSSLLQLDMLKNLYSKYNSSIAIITVVVNEQDWKRIDEKLKLESIPWKVVIAKDFEELSKMFQLTTTPHYVLIDSQGYIVQSPAASPVPDGSYKTIDYYFFEIHKAMSGPKR